MDAEHLIALEAAFAELGGLYTAARNFTKLVDRAEADLLPRLTALSARLRGLHRTGGMAQPDIDAASRDIIELRATWQSALEEIRQSQEYAGARDAFQNDDQAALAGLIPRVFAGMTPVEPTARVYFGVSTEVRRRGPGSSPFLSAAACAEKIEAIERKALAAAEIQAEFQSDDLMDQFKKLEYKGTADQQLMDLKAKMGMLGAGTRETKALGAGGKKKGDAVHDAELLENGETKP